MDTIKHCLLVTLTAKGIKRGNRQPLFLLSILRYNKMHKRMLQTFSGQQSNMMHILQPCWIWRGKFQLLDRSVFAVRVADSSAAFYYYSPSVLGRRLGTKPKWTVVSPEQHVCIAQTLALQTEINNQVEALPYLYQWAGTSPWEKCAGRCQGLCTLETQWALGPPMMAGTAALLSLWHAPKLREWGLEES